MSAGADFADTTSTGGVLGCAPGAPRARPTRRAPASSRRAPRSRGVGRCARAPACRRRPAARSWPAASRLRRWRSKMSGSSSTTRTRAIVECSIGHESVTDEADLAGPDSTAPMLAAGVAAGCAARRSRGRRRRRARRATMPIPEVEHAWPSRRRRRSPRRWISPKIRGTSHVRAVDDGVDAAGSTPRAGCRRCRHR